ncbi:MAG: FtsX-like permease family protein [Suipraeoptans sp.]
MTLFNMQAKLRKANKKNYFLYLFCNFVAMMLITAYTAMMMSPTVLDVLPEGGDSRKQMNAVFVLAAIGCIFFTVYGCSLFFRMKSKEIGLLMALGASPKRIAIMLLSETALLSTSSALGGMLMGIPFAAMLWGLFRLFIINSKEMVLRFNFQCLFIALLFLLFVVFAAFVTGIRYLRKTNIIEVLHEEHQNESIPRVGRFTGYIGIILLIVGALCGYSAPSIYMNIMSAYPPAWLNILYVPVFIGLYMILLHTVVHGWKRHRNYYKGIISRSMMKFQGRQTVNNMLVVALLSAGAIFGIFYMPISMTGSTMAVSNRPFDYAYYKPQDTAEISKSDVTELADNHQLGISNWHEHDFITLGMDGINEVEDDGNKFHEEHVDLLMEGIFLSESSYEEITGQNIDVAIGTYYAINNDEQTHDLFFNSKASILTNMSTREQLYINYAGSVIYELFTNYGNSVYVINDADYKNISVGLTDDWRGTTVLFNVEGEDSYDFADELLYTFIDSFSGHEAVPSYYDRVFRTHTIENGETYWGDTDAMSKLSFNETDNAEFRGYWKYMPLFKIMNKSDMLKNLAVFFMMFLFIGIICITTVIIVCYTRCMTIAVNNGYVFKDLRRLGGSSRFIKKELRSQAVKVYAIPYLTGSGIMSLFYVLIMYGNDGRLSGNEIAGLLVCFWVLLLISLVIYALYRFTLKRMEMILL